MSFTRLPLSSTRYLIRSPIKSTRKFSQLGTEYIFVLEEEDRWAHMKNPQKTSPRPSKYSPTIASAWFNSHLPGSLSEGFVAIKAEIQMNPIPKLISSYIISVSVGNEHDPFATWITKNTV